MTLQISTLDKLVVNDLQGPDIMGKGLDKTNHNQPGNTFKPGLDLFPFRGIPCQVPC